MNTFYRIKMLITLSALFCIFFVYLLLHMHTHTYTLEFSYKENRTRENSRNYLSDICECFLRRHQLCAPPKK